MKIRVCKTAEDFALATKITRAYIDWIDIDLSFQDIDSELASFDSMYGPPRGCFLLCSDEAGLAGGVGVRELGQGVCEMKRLYVYDSSKGKGVATLLCRELISHASSIGYSSMRLDTLGPMKAARKLYQKLGFREIPSYRYNPQAETVYMELELGPEKD